MKLKKRILLLVFGIFLVLSGISVIQNRSNFSDAMNTDLSEHLAEMERDARGMTTSMKNFCLALSANQLDRAEKSLSQEVRPKLTFRELADLGMDQNIKSMQCKTLEILDIESDSGSKVSDDKINP